MTTTAAARETSRAATLSIVSNSLLTTLKLLAGFLTGSVSVLAEGIHSANDLLASFLAWFAIRKANEPADVEHRYGHGKFESLSAFVEAALIIAAALSVAWTAIGRLRGVGLADLQHGPAILAMAVSAVTNLLVSSYLFRIAHRHDSVALAADGWHLRADVWTSLGVFASLLVIRLTDWHLLDPLAAIMVALLILFQGGRIGREALGQLLDRSLPRAEMAIIQRLLSEHDDMFVDYHRLRTRKAGRERQIDLHLVTCPQVTVESAHRVCDHLEQDIAARMAHTRVVIHVEPCDERSCPNRTAPQRDVAACVLKQRAASSHPRTGGPDRARDPGNP